MDGPPTSRQSGSFGVMADACRLSITELTRLLSAGDRKDAAHLRALLAEAHQLAAAVEGWELGAPVPEAKQHVIGEILSLRGRVLAVSGETDLEF